MPKIVFTYLHSCFWLYHRLIVGIEKKSSPICAGRYAQIKCANKSFGSMPHKICYVKRQQRVIIFWAIDTVGQNSQAGVYSCKNAYGQGICHRLYAVGVFELTILAASCVASEFQTTEPKSSLNLIIENNKRREKAWFTDFLVNRVILPAKLNAERTM